MKSFPNGARVETDTKYFNDFGRKVIGVVVRPDHLRVEQPNEVTFVKWLKQMGNIIPPHQDKVVLMRTQDLQYSSQ